MLMMSLGPILFGLNSTIALPVARETEADLIPPLLISVRSIRLTQDEQLIPDTYTEHSNNTHNIIMHARFQNIYLYDQDL